MHESKAGSVTWNNSSNSSSKNLQEKTTWIAILISIFFISSLYFLNYSIVEDIQLWDFTLSLWNLPWTSIITNCHTHIFPIFFLLYFITFTKKPKYYNVFCSYYSFYWNEELLFSLQSIYLHKYSQCSNWWNSYFSFQPFY